MAVKKLDEDNDPEVTLVPCPACIAGMVRPRERERLRRIMTMAPPPVPDIDLASFDLDEDGPA